MGSLLDVCACSNKYENIATDWISLCEGEDRENRCGYERFWITREVMNLRIFQWSLYLWSRYSDWEESEYAICIISFNNILFIISHNYVQDEYMNNTINYKLFLQVIYNFQIMQGFYQFLIFQLSRYVISVIFQQKNFGI